MTVPTAEHLAALERFRAQHGRRWKAWLRAAWETGVYPIYARDNGDAALLQQVRNSLGTSWLAKYRGGGPCRQQ
jgi:hypothetical protein